MGINYGDRIYNSVVKNHCGNRIRKKVAKKKRRRNARAGCNDGRDRKRANSLTPALQTSKRIFMEGSQ